MAKDFEVKVNGVQFNIDRQFPSASDILVLAKEKDAIPGNPDKYILQGEKGKYAGDAIVDLEQDNIFITVPTQPTPVA